MDEKLYLAPRERLDLVPKEKLKEEIVQHVATGGTLHEYCKAMGWKYPKLAWMLHEDPELARAYQNARVVRQEFLAEHITSRLKEIESFDFASITDEEGNILPPAQWPEHARAAIHTYTQVESAKTKRIQVKISDKLKSLEMLGKAVAMFKDYVEHHHTVSLDELVTQAAEAYEAEFVEVEPKALPAETEETKDGD